MGYSSRGWDFSGWRRHRTGRSSGGSLGFVGNMIMLFLIAGLFAAIGYIFIKYGFWQIGAIMLACAALLYSILPLSIFFKVRKIKRLRNVVPPVVGA